MIADARYIPLKDESVQCVVTSPPYWGLRKYSISDSIWDGVEGCEHQWGNARKSSQRLRNGEGSYTAKQSVPMTLNPSTGQFCLLCSAWRGQLGLEPTIDLYVSHLVQVFREIWRVLRKDGVCFLNLGDSYGGQAHSDWNVREDYPEEKKTGGFHSKLRKDASILPVFKGRSKDLCLIPARVALALQADGWWIRSDIIWAKPNPMPESVTDRPTRSHEYIFLLTKSQHYFWDQDAVKEKGAQNKWGKYSNPKYNIEGVSGKMQSAKDLTKEEYLEKYQERNIRSVWTIATEPYKESHYAVFPQALVERCIKAGCPKEICLKCGKPREKIFTREGMTSREWQKIRGLGIKGSDPKMGIQGKSIAGGRPPDPIYEEIGFTDCGCDAGFCPGVCLDPFAGSGTVQRVAERLNRIGIGLDLGYEGLREKRMKNIQKELFS